MPKYLLIRFGAIGDVVLTTPVIRSLKRAQPEAEIHFLTKAAHTSLLAWNPYLSEVKALGPKDALAGLARQLGQERYDAVLDLHGSLRSRALSLFMGRRFFGFDKANEQKKRLTRQQPLTRPIAHIVERYAQTLHPLCIALDGGGLDFFLPPGYEAEARERLLQAGIDPERCLAVALGATHATKRWPAAYFAQTLEALGRPCVLLGGADARAEADRIAAGISVPCFNATGRFDLLQAAALLKACPELLTHDTGFMHIGAAFGMKIFSLWGSTVPAFGMTPWQAPHVPLEISGLSCRPCSRIGFDACPKGHFQCMRSLSPAKVIAVIHTENKANEA